MRFDQSFGHSWEGLPALSALLIQLDGDRPVRRIGFIGKPKFVTHSAEGVSAPFLRFIIGKFRHNPAKVTVVYLFFLGQCFQAEHFNIYQCHFVNKSHSTPKGNKVDTLVTVVLPLESKLKGEARTAVTGQASRLAYELCRPKEPNNDATTERRICVKFGSPSPPGRSHLTGHDPRGRNRAVQLDSGTNPKANGLFRRHFGGLRNGTRNVLVAQSAHSRALAPARQRPGHVFGNYEWRTVATTNVKPISFQSFPAG
jgi:hypothetical protein